MKNHRKYNFPYIAFGIFILLFSIACNQTKYVKDGQYLLVENEIIIEKDSTLLLNLLSKTGVTQEDLLPIVKQQPNRKIIIGKFHLWLYNRSNQSRIDKRIVKQQKKVDKKNEKIAAKNEKIVAKDPNAELKEYKERKNTFGESLRTAGEAPVILDSIKVEKTADQMHLYLLKKGYFNNTVRDSIVLLDDTLEVNGKKQYPSKRAYQKAKVIYIINPHAPYKVSKYEWDIKDPRIAEVVASLSKDSVVKKGNNFDTDALETERKRVTDHLLENGFFFFNKEFIYFKVDSTLGKDEVALNMGIQNFKYTDLVNDSVKDKPHRAYKISNIYVYPDFHPKDDEYTKYDELELDGVTVRHKRQLKIKPALLADMVMFKTGELYQKSLEETTYKKFMSLGNFRAVKVAFDADQGDSTLTVKVFLEPSKSQTFTVATDGTQTNGLFGIEGSMTYMHNNIFGGAERLQITMAGGLEMQRLIYGSDSSTINSEVSSVNEIAKTFNTLEFGPKISLTIPRMLFIQPTLEKIVKRNFSNAKTEFTGSVNYQRRPDFKRSIEEFSFGWIYHESAPITIRFNPLVISAIAIEKSTEFEALIEELNDRFLAASYQDHIIAGGKLSFIYNGQNDKKVKNTFYVQTTLETGGNLLRGVYSLIGVPYANDSLESYDLFGIRYAQFVKISADLRYYFPLAKKSKIVYRLAGGVGKPLANLNEALPFEKSFFGGGSNGLRAWKARTIGPGSYNDPEFRFDKIGDIQLEGNVEVRFPLLSWVEGALFVDAGNIWLLNKDSLRQGGQFDRKTFISEIAIGGGAGLRLDFDFFVIRLDVALPIKHPAMPLGKRWIWDSSLTDERKPYFKPQFNLGIGYPF